MSTKLYVGNLSYEVSEKELTELFSQAGTVQSVTIVTDKLSARSRGFGFVEMSTQEEANKAKSMLNGTSLHQREILVDEAKPPKSGSRPGSRGPRERGRGRW